MTRNQGSSRRPNLSSAAPIFDSKNSISTRLHDDYEHTCALSNPFCPAARGSKVPDTDSSKSVPITVTHIQTIANDAVNGCAAVYVRPNVAAATTISNAITNSSVGTWGATAAVDGYATLAASFNTYRIVSWGVKIMNVAAALNKKGSYRIITMPDDPTGGAFPYTGGFFEEVHDLSVYEDHIYWISRPKGSDHTRYKHFGTTSTDYPEWDNVCIIMRDGTVGATELQIQVVYHLECQVALGQIVSGVATDAAPYKPAVIAARGRVHAKHGGTNKGPGVLKRLANVAWNSLVESAASFVPVIGNHIGRMLRAPTARPLLMDRVVEVD